MIQVGQTYTHEPFKNSFLWLVAEKEAKESKCEKGATRGRVSVDEREMSWRCHGRGQSQRVKEGPRARTRECSLDSDSPYLSAKQKTEISVPQSQGCGFCQQE